MLWKDDNQCPGPAHMAGPHHLMEGVLQNMSSMSDETYAIFLDSEEEIRWTWHDLQSHSNTVMESLEGLERGVVLIFLRDMREMHSAFFGSMMAGLIPSFMPCSSPKQDPDIYWSSHSRLLSRIKPKAILTSPDVHTEMKDAGLDLNAVKVLYIEQMEPKENQSSATILNSDEIALLQHSSGTTGLKKGVALSHRAVALHAERYGNSIEATREDIIASWLPLYHDMGLMACMLMPAYLGIPILQMDPFKWVADPSKFLSKIEEYEATLIWMPNFAFELYSRLEPVFRKKSDLSSIRMAISCSEICKAETLDKFCRLYAGWGLKKSAFQVCYAMAETVFATSHTSNNGLVNRISVNSDSINEGDSIEIVNDGNVIISCGKSIEGLHLSIHNEDGDRVEDGAIGEIGVSGDYLFDGYFLLEDLTSSRFVNGIFMTRDMGFMLQDELYVLGRKDDMIIVQGRNIFAHEIEALLLDVEGLKPGRSVAFGVSDEVSGSEALVVMCEYAEKGGRVDDIKKNIRTIIESSLGVVPKKVEIVDLGWLIKTSSGKIDRKKNKQKFMRGG